MHEQDGRTDPVEQRHEGVAVQDLLLPEIPDRRQLTRDQLPDDRIVRLAASRPLGVQVRLRPELVFFLGDVASLRIFTIDQLGRPVDFGLIGGSSAPGLIHDVDCITQAH
ncbi:MAG: hypothetical protein E6H75_03060 [Betaproteobacteria bacterium]|nr:MAG: hypothetical protein E6H75_03060 [Betaproteobacteria bacterium]